MKRTLVLASLCVVITAGCNSGSSALPSATLATVDDVVIECREVPDDLCQAYADGTIAGPQPSGSGQIVGVVVTCELNPPCAPDRRDSGGTIIVTYDDGTTWSQAWAVGSGT